MRLKSAFYTMSFELEFRKVLSVTFEKYSNTMSHTYISTCICTYKNLHTLFLHNVKKCWGSKINLRKFNIFQETSVHVVRKKGKKFGIHK